MIFKIQLKCNFNRYYQIYKNANMQNRRWGKASWQGKRSDMEFQLENLDDGHVPPIQKIDALADSSEDDLVTDNR